MHYLSTRGSVPPRSFEEILLEGLAPDGGLYVPERFPHLAEAELAALCGRAYAEVTAALMTPYAAGTFEAGELSEMAHQACAAFDHAAVAPLVQIGPNDFLLELFHGPTLAFKDLALQLLGRMFDRVLARRGLKVTVLGATSGDTGSAAIAAFAGHANVEVVILHPKGRVSEVQRRQMTCVDAPNVRNVAIEGTFDDCQALVKAMFADPALRQRLGLAAVNSINWARVAAQSVYYVTAALSLGAPARAVAFAVPTGNFGDVYAGYVARRMGIRIHRLVVATNANDILARFFATGRYRTAAVVETLCPSMDIQVASNFERLLYELVEHDGARVAAIMEKLDREGGFSLAGPALASARAVFAAHRASDREILAEIARLHAASGLLVDPHTAAGLVAARAQRPPPEVPMVALATAHPAKFADAVARATGVRPELPARLADLYARDERYDVLPNDVSRLKAYLLAVPEATRAGAGGA